MCIISTIIIFHSLSMIVPKVDCFLQTLYYFFCVYISYAKCYFSHLNLLHLEIPFMVKSKAKPKSLHWFFV